MMFRIKSDPHSIYLQFPSGLMVAAINIESNSVILLNDDLPDWCFPEIAKIRDLRHTIHEQAEQLRMLRLNYNKLVEYLHPLPLDVIGTMN